jgi:hypothetical protein
MESTERDFCRELYMVEHESPRIGRLARSYIPPLPLEDAKNRFDLDELHEPILNNVANIYSSLVHGIHDFRFRYPTSGSSEGLFHLMNWLRMSGVTMIYTLAGEYEGFSAYASHCGIATMTVDRELDACAQLPAGVWFLSNPSARFGNTLPQTFIDSLCESGHKIVLDLAYLGLTAPVVQEVHHPNIIAVVTSLSKPFGLFRFRIGALFSRLEIPSLYGNRWFKDIGRHLQGLRVLQVFGLHRLYERYRPLQLEIVNKLQSELQIPIEASDVLLLAHMRREVTPESKRVALEPYLRHQHYRLCLTPYFESDELEEHSATRVSSSSKIKETFDLTPVR